MSYLRVNIQNDNYGHKKNHTFCTYNLPFTCCQCRRQASPSFGTTTVNIQQHCKGTQYVLR